jgi:hypothetical protein
VTCLGSSTDPAVRDKARAANGCDATRAGLPHVHTKAVGGITVIAPGWWIFAVPGGPWAAQPDETFRGGWEIPEPGGVTHEQVEAALATKTCQHCDAVTQLDEPHSCPQMEAVKEAHEVPAEHIESNPYHESTATGNPTEEIPGTLPHPAVDGPHPTETEADLHTF